MQNKNQFIGYANKEEIFKIIDYDIKKNKDVYKESFLCHFFDKCDCY